MSTDTLEIIELDEALDFKPGCEGCGDDATHQVNHPINTSHLICTGCADVLKDMLRFKSLEIHCILCTGNDMSKATAFYAEDVTVEPL